METQNGTEAIVEVQPPNGLKEIDNRDDDIVIVKVEDNGVPLSNSNLNLNSVSSSDNESHTEKEEPSSKSKFHGTDLTINHTTTRQSEAVHNSDPISNPTSGNEEEKSGRDEAALAMAALASFSNNGASKLSSNGTVNASRASEVEGKIEAALVTEMLNLTSSPQLQPGVAAPQALPPMNNRVSSETSSMGMTASPIPSQPYDHQGFFQNASANMNGSFNEMVMMAAYQQSQQQSGNAASMLNVAATAGMMKNTDLQQVFTPEETLRIFALQEQIQQNATHFAQATYTAQLQNGVADIVAKEQARLMFQDLLQKGQQSLNLQIQTLYQQKMQQILQQRALESMRIQQQQQQQQQLAGRNGASLLGGVSMMNSGLPSQLPIKNAANGAISAGSVSSNGGAFNILCQAADERPVTGMKIDIPSSSSSGGGVASLPLFAASSTSRGSPRSSLEKQSTDRSVSSTPKEDAESKKWRDHLIKKIIEVEYDGEWYAARVVSRQGNVFVVLYDEDETEEKMRLFDDYTAQDPEGDDNFRWRMKAKREGKRNSDTMRRRKSDEGEETAVPVSEKEEETLSMKKSVAGDGMSEASSSALREQRERRAELRAIANQRRLEDETLLSAKKLEAEAQTLKKRAEEEFKRKREEYEAEKKGWDKERKTMDDERAVFEKVKSEAQAAKRENEAILRQIKEERSVLEKLQKTLERLQAADAATSNAVDSDRRRSKVAIDSKKPTSTATKVEESGKETVKKGRRGRPKKNSSVAEQAQPIDDHEESDEEENDNDETSEVDDEKKSREGKVREEEDETTDRRKRKRTTNKEEESPKEESADEGEESGVDEQSQSEEEEEGEEGDDEEDDDAEDEEEDQTLQVQPRKRGRPKGSGKKKPGPKRSKSVDSTGRVPSRKIIPVKRLEAGLSGKWTSNKAPRALGFIPKGRYGFAPPDGPRAVAWRVRVWWKDDKKFYEGMIESYRNNRHKVVYDDGDVEWLHLDDEKIEWFVPEGADMEAISIDPSEAFAK